MFIFFNKLRKSVFNLFLPYQFTFVQAHNFLSKNELVMIKEILHNEYKPSYSCVTDRYENIFSSYIGNGKSSSFASGRMAFYSLMKILNISKGDEVVLTGFTCSVMANAILKIGAKPVYADVDKFTFGSSAISIERVITNKTKLIVAQHSFGIPCEIDKIMSLAKEKKIFVVEDCAISFGSSYLGVNVGDWGDASIFSTDHSKPINTIIGGILYTKNRLLQEEIKKFMDSIPHLSFTHQKNIYRQILFEINCFKPNVYPRKKIYSIFYEIWRFFFNKNEYIFLEDNYGANANLKEGYPYPARMPSFLAYLGIIQLGRWDKEKEVRKKILKFYLKKFSSKHYDIDIPLVYFDKSREIIPLRFVFISKNTKFMLNKISKYFDVSWIWFRQPIATANCDLENFYYETSQCPVSESICTNIVNFPCNLNSDSATLFYEAMSKI